MVYIFILVLELCLLISVVAYGNRYPRKQVKWIFAFLIIALAGIGACVEPKYIYDLFRHYEVLDSVRYSSYSLGSFLEEGYQITDFNYRYTYVYNIFVYIVAKFLPNQAFPFITIVVTYSLFSYIIFREFGDEALTNRNIILSFAIFSVLMPYLFVYSNIRNALAGAVVAYGIYRLYKDRKVAIFVMCTVSAVLIHPVAAAIVPFIILSRIKPGVKGIIVTLAVPSLMFPVMEYFRLVFENDFLFAIASKYYNYTLVRVDDQGRIFLYSTIIILIILSVLALWSQRRKKMERKEKSYALLNLIIWYSMFSLGYFSNYEMITRLPYTIAFLSPVVVNTLFNHTEMNTSVAQIACIGSAGVIFVLALFGVYANIAWML